MGATLTTLDQFLKDVYLPGLPDFVNKQHPLMDRLEQITDKKKFRGRKFIFSARLRNSQGGGAIIEGETLPVPGNSTPLSMELTLKHHYQTAKITRQAMDYGTDDGAFGDAVTFELDGARNQLTEDLAKNLSYGTGYGELGQVSAYSGTTLTMIGNTTNGGVGTRFLNAGGYYSSYSALSGGVQGANHKNVSNITSATVATAEASAGFTANDYVFRSVTASTDPRNKATMGLGGIVDAGDLITTIQTKSRTTYPELKACKLGNSGTLRAWTPELMADLCSEANQNGGGGYPTSVWSLVELQKRAASYLWTDRRGKMDDMNIEGGYSGVWWNAPGAGRIPWYQDRYYRAHTIHAIREADLFMAVGAQAGISESKTDGSMWRATGRADEWECWMYTDLNLGCRQFNNHAKLDDVSYTL